MTSEGRGVERKLEGDGGGSDGHGIEVPPFRPDPQLVRWREGGSKESAVRAFKRTMERMERERAQLQARPVGE